MTTETSNAREWPEELMIRDTGLHDDIGGAQQQGQAVAWQRSIEIRPGYWGEWAEYTDLYGEGRPEKVGRFNCRYRPLYTAPPSAPVGVEGLVVAARKLRDSARGMDDGNRWVPGAVFKQFSKAVTAALAQQPAAVDGAPPPIYYMRDNHTFKRLSENVSTALAEIEGEFNTGYTYGTLCSKRNGFESVHASGDKGRMEFFANCKAALATQHHEPKS